MSRKQENSISENLMLLAFKKFDGKDQEQKLLDMVLCSSGLAERNLNMELQMLSLNIK